MEQILHLFVTNKCRHNCALCCNRMYKIDEIPTVTVDDLKKMDTVLLTGGEPLGLEGFELEQLVHRIRGQFPNIKNLYVYTSGLELIQNLSSVYELTRDGLINGINVCPKDKDDWEALKDVLEYSCNIFGQCKSNRLYVFPEWQKHFESLNIDPTGLNLEIVGRKWDRVFSTANNEFFMRLPILY